MIINIDQSSSKPVYQQIIDIVKYAVAAGRLKEGESLAPIREVAVQARVNRNTVAKAYSELEREGVIRSRAGQGSFISGQGPALSREKSREMLASSIDDFLAQAHLFQMSRQEIEELVQERLEGLKF